MLQSFLHVCGQGLVEASRLRHFSKTNWGPLCHISHVAMPHCCTPTLLFFSSSAMAACCPTSLEATSKCSSAWLELLWRTRFLCALHRMLCFHVIRKSWYGCDPDAAAQAKVNPAHVRIAADAALVIDGAGVSVQALDLDGALVVTAVPGAASHRFHTGGGMPEATFVCSSMTGKPAVNTGDGREHTLDALQSFCHADALPAWPEVQVSVHISAGQSSNGWHGGVTGAHVTLDGLELKNAGWKWQALNPNKPMTEEQAIRCMPALLGPCQAVSRHGCMGGAGTLLVWNR